MFFHTSVCQWFTLELKQVPQVYRTLLSILANLNNAVLWMVFACPIISKSSSLCTNLLVIVPSTPITPISLSLSHYIVCFFFQLSNKVKVLISLFAFFLFHSFVDYSTGSFFLLTRFGRDEMIRFYLKILLLVLVVVIYSLDSFFYTSVSWWYFIVV